MQTNHTQKLACTLIQFPLVRPCYLASCSASMKNDLQIHGDIRAYSFKDVYLRAWTCIYAVYKFQLCWHDYCIGVIFIQRVCVRVCACQWRIDSFATFGCTWLYCTAWFSLFEIYAPPPQTMANALAGSPALAVISEPSGSRRRRKCFRTHWST